MIKTNVMRILDQHKIAYNAYEYEVDEDHLAGTYVAEQIGVPKEQVFKTIVTIGEKRGHMVFCIPVEKELDLKKAAKVVGDKKVNLLHVKDLLKTTGYIRGGCSPIGMKKKFPTFIDASALLYENITISAGIRGCQLMIDREKFVSFVEGMLIDVTEE